MQAPVKYRFERTFDTGARPGETEAAAIERRLRQSFDAELKATREVAYDEGFADGTAASRDSLEAQIAATAADLLARTAVIEDDMARTCADIRAASVRIAIAAAEALAPELIRREPIAALEALFGECLDYAGEAPHIAIRVNDELAERVRRSLEKLAAERGFQGRVRVIADAQLTPGEGRLEWADGGMARDFDATRERIAATVTHYLAARDGDRGNGVARPPAPNGADAAPPDRPAPPAHNANGLGDSHE